MTVVAEAGAVFETPRVALGPISLQDADTMFRWQNDPEAARTDYAWRPVDGLAQQRWFSTLGTDPTQVWFAVRRRDPGPDQGRMVGFVVLRHISTVHRSVELGLRIGSEADRSQGFGREAARLAVTYCWESLNLERIQVVVFGDNERSLRLFRSLGFEREGALRRASYVGGAWHDNIILGLLRPGHAG